VTGAIVTSTSAAEEVPVVLLPGMHGTAELFDPFVARCPQGFRTLVVSYPTDRPLPIRELVERVRAALPSGRWILLGESFSGVVAIRLAASRPPGLVGLVLVATAARWSRIRFLRSAPLTALFAARTPTPILKWLLAGDAAPELIAATRTAITAASPSILAARLRELASVDVRQQLEQVGVPVLYLRARQDRLVRSAEARSIESARQGVDVRIVDAPHFLVQSRPDDAWEQIVAFARARCAA
jgi:pimeloyl-ACP methyl ester carboxylesterase